MFHPPAGLEQVAIERARDREAWIVREHLYSQLPRPVPFWRRLLGKMMVLAGDRIAHWGDAVARQEPRLELQLD